MAIARRASLSRRLLFVALAIFLQGAQAALASHILDPCDVVAELLEGEGCTQACEQCAPQTGQSETLPPAAWPDTLPRLAHVQIAARREAPFSSVFLSFRGRAPPRLS